METLIGLIILFCIFILPRIITNYKFDHRLPPTGYKTDYGAMNSDLIMGKSKIDVIRKCNNGEYDVKK